MVCDRNHAPGLLSRHIEMVLWALSHLQDFKPALELADAAQDASSWKLSSLAFAGLLSESERRGLFVEEQAFLRHVSRLEGSEVQAIVETSLVACLAEAGDIEAALHLAKSTSFSSGLLDRILQACGADLISDRSFS